MIQETSEARKSRGAMSWLVTDLARLPRPPALARSSATTKNWRLAGSPVSDTCSPASSSVMLGGCIASLDDQDEDMHASYPIAKDQIRDASAV